MKEKYRINVIWGTGDRSSTFSKGCANLPEFYIDNDLGKSGKLFFERPVKHPSEITDWDNYFIIVANSYYNEIKVQLTEKGLKENEDYIYYEKVVNNGKRIQTLVQESMQSLKLFKEKYADYKGSILIFGSMISFDKNSYLLFNEANALLSPEKKILMISETHATKEKDKEGKISFPYFLLPLLFWQNYHLKENISNKIECDKSMIEYVERKEYRKSALKDFKGKNPDVAEGFTETFIYHADLYLREMMDFIHPEKVLIWNQFYPFHTLIGGICSEKRIDLLYMEYGVLSGSYVLERTGQMGESYPAIHVEEFQKLSVSEEDIESAHKIKDYLKRSGINRKPQPQEDSLQQVVTKLDQRKHTIIYYGQNDYESGLYPYTEHAKEYHSPIFSSSGEAAVFLADIAMKNGWNFIYKPHPMCMDTSNKEKIIALGAFYIERCNINELVDIADVNITILSTVAYISLIRDKATLMLGFTQLKDKECTYQAFSRDAVEGQMKCAVQNGLTTSQKEAFVRHIARLNRYYLFDDLDDKEVRVGQDWRKLCTGKKLMF